MSERTIIQCSECKEQLYGLFATEGIEGDACPICGKPYKGETIQVVPLSHYQQTLDALEAIADCTVLTDDGIAPSPEAKLARETLALLDKESE